MTNRWRAPEDGRRPSGLIGPNAILQFLPVLAADAPAADGGDPLPAMLRAAGITALPDGRSMIPESEAARLHRWLRRAAPDRAAARSAEAGRRTADYILAHRIPKPAQRLLTRLPAGLAAPLLASAISRHAWTFAGSGRFRVVGSCCLEIADNPLVRGETSAEPLCAWHAAVFERLYRVLVAPDFRCRETTCCAQGAGSVCRFELTRGGR